ncbi:MAG: class I adenylate-forming enzyme family protein [Armatimonadota bacterium]
MRSIRDFWDNCVRKWPRKVGVICGERELSYDDLDRRTARLANAFRSRLGVRKGDRVAVVMPNCLEFFLTYWATIRLGAVVVPVNTRLKPEGIRHVVRSTEPRLLVSHASVHDALKEALRDCDGGWQAAAVGLRDEDGVVPFDELDGGEERDWRELGEDDLAVIAHTSGTTGVPKGAMMHHGDLIFNVRNSIIAHGFRHDDVHLQVSPMFHCTALYSVLPGAAYLGSTVVIAPNPDVREIVRLIEKHRITMWLGVPTMFYFLVTMRDLDRHDLSSLKVIGYAGSPMPPETIRRLREKFPWAELRNFFGLTETISVTHVLPSPDALRHPESVGKLLPEVAMRIVDEGGNDVGPGEVGELCFHRRNVVKGYWGRPELLEESMLGDWFRTGDFALQDEEGYLFLKGRKKDMMIVGGENVFAVEVENVLVGHPDVLEAAVVGVEATGVRSYLGELVKAVVVARPGAQINELDIKRHCAERLPSYKTPQIVEFRDSLPRNPAGKVLKNELK